MFSGIVRHIGEVISLDEGQDVSRLELRSELFAQLGTALGDSIAVSGVCLTIVSLEADRASFDLATETRRVSSLGQLVPGSKVNLEASLALGDRLHGHFVQGHVDAQVKIVQSSSEENTEKFAFDLPAAWQPYLVPKGSVTLDGVSLTVGEVQPGQFSVYVIPHTLEETTLGAWTHGQLVNLEVDCLARYVVGAAMQYQQQSQKQGL